MSADGQESAQKLMTKYSIPTRKMVRGGVLDSPSKGKSTETCVAEGTMRVRSEEHTSELQSPC